MLQIRIALQPSYKCERAYRVSIQELSQISCKLMQLIVGNVTCTFLFRYEPNLLSSTIYSTLVGCDVTSSPESKQIIEYSTFSVVPIDRHSYPRSTLKPISFNNRTVSSVKPFFKFCVIFFLFLLSFFFYKAFFHESMDYTYIYFCFTIIENTKNISSYKFWPTIANWIFINSKFLLLINVSLEIFISSQIRN